MQVIPRFGHTKRHVERGLRNAARWLTGAAPRVPRAWLFVRRSSRAPRHSRTRSLWQRRAPATTQSHHPDAIHGKRLCGRGSFRTYTFRSLPSISSVLFYLRIVCKPCSPHLWRKLPAGKTRHISAVPPASQHLRKKSSQKRTKFSQKAGTAAGGPLKFDKRTTTFASLDNRQCATLAGRTTRIFYLNEF